MENLTPKKKIETWNRNSIGWIKIGKWRWQKTHKSGATLIEIVYFYNRDFIFKRMDGFSEARDMVPNSWTLV